MDWIGDIDWTSIPVGITADEERCFTVVGDSISIVVRTGPAGDVTAIRYAVEIAVDAIVRSGTGIPKVTDAVAVRVRSIIGRIISAARTIVATVTIEIAAGCIVQGSVIVHIDHAIIVVVGV